MVSSPNRASVWIRAALLVLLLTGSLLSNGGMLVAVAAVVLVPIVVWTVVRGLPIVHWSACMVVIVAVPIAASIYLKPPVTDYGQTKVSTFFLLTLPAAGCAVLIRNYRDLSVWAKVWVGCGCLLAVLALVGQVDTNGRATGWFDSNPIWLARAIGSPVVALVWLAYRRAISRHIALAIGALLVAGLYATGSRGPVVAMTIGVLTVIVFTAAAGRILRAATLALTVFVGIYLAMWLQLIPLTSRIGSMLVDFHGEVTTSDRATLAGLTMDLIAGHPWGVGLGNWSEQLALPMYRYPHNLWLEVLAEAGWITGGLLIAVTLWVVRRLWRASRTDSAAVLTLALLAFEITSVSFSGDLNARSFFFTLALGYAVSQWSALAARRSVRPEWSPGESPAALSTTSAVRA